MSSMLKCSGAAFDWDESVEFTCAKDTALRRKSESESKADRRTMASSTFVRMTEQDTPKLSRKCKFGCGPPGAGTGTFIHATISSQTLIFSFLAANGAAGSPHGSCDRGNWLRKRAPGSH